jgi:hypothetical protein
MTSASSQPTSKAIALTELGNLQTECNQLLARIKAFSPPDPQTNQYDSTFRLIATPMLYSVWERAFSMSHAISLRLIRDVSTSASVLPPERRAIWLVKEPCYQSFVTRLKTPKSPSDKIKKGEFKTLVDFLGELDNFAASSVPATPTEDLVMTFSNVNKKVVSLNADALGISALPQYQAIKFGRLNNLLDWRNDIGHGARISPPPNQEFIDLIDFTENLVKDYTDLFIDWITAQF